MGEKLAPSPEEVSQKWRQFRASGKTVRLSHVSQCIVEVCDSFYRKGNVEIALGLDRMYDSGQVLIGRYSDLRPRRITRTPVSIRLNGVARLDHLELNKIGSEVEGLRFRRNGTIGRMSPRYPKSPQLVDSILDALDHTLELGLPREVFVHPVFDLAKSP